MMLLSKFFLAALLVTMASVGWAACPEGYKNNYKGECVDASGKPLPKYLRKFDTDSGVLFGQEDDGSGTFRGFFYHGRNPHTPYAVATYNVQESFDLDGTIVSYNISAIPTMKYGKYFNTTDTQFNLFLNLGVTIIEITVIIPIFP